MALNEPYADMPSTRGFLYYKDQDVYNFVKEADNRGMQCSMHATGDRAIDQYIYVLDRVIRENGKKNLRHRIEHFSMPADRHIEMAVELELALPMQPIFTKIWDTEKKQSV
jgi:predicted amidohydrolase YtcJ